MVQLQELDSGKTPFDSDDFTSTVTFSLLLFPYSCLDSFVFFYITFISLVLCRWRDGRRTYDWQAKAIPQMGRQRNTPSQRTTLTCSSHQPLSSPCLNEDSTIWREGGGVTARTKCWKVEGEHEGGGCTHANGSQVIKGMNGERNRYRKSRKRHDRKHKTEQKTCEVLKVVRDDEKSWFELKKTG